MDHELINKLFSYDEETGIIKRVCVKEDDIVALDFFCSLRSLRISNSKAIKNRQGTVRQNKAGNEYLNFRIQGNNKGINLDAHLIIWFLKHKVWPVEVDHIDGNGLNNKLENLREVTREINNKNHRRQKNNSSGITGVNYRKDINKWRAYSYKNRSQVQLGVFDTLLDAACVRKSYENINGYTKRHGE